MKINTFESAKLFVIFIKMNQMTPIENIYAAIGEAAYAVAMSDGKIQREEKEKFEQILNDELDGRITSSSHASIIFQVMHKEHTSTEDAYYAAMHTFKTNSHYLSQQMKDHFIRIINRVAESFPPATEVEKKLIAKFKTEIESLKIDPTLSKDL